jgi:hypothetical protein
MCAHIALGTCAAVSSNAAFWKGTTRRRLNTQRGEKERKKPRLQTPTHTKKKRKRRRHEQHNIEIYSKKKNWTRAKEIAGNQECAKKEAHVCMYVCVRTAGNVSGGVIQGHETSRRQHNNLIWFLEQMVQGPCEGISWCLGVVHSYDNLPIGLHCRSTITYKLRQSK